VALGWGRQEICYGSPVEVDRGLDDWLSKNIKARLLTLVQESLKNCREDSSHACLGKIWNPYHVKMSEETRRDSVPATTWWSTGAYKSGVLDLFKDELFGVVESSGVYRLT